MTSGSWCSRCDQLLPYYREPCCPVCALPSPNAQTCGQCLKKPPAFNQTTTLFTYQYPADLLIQRFKYQEQLSLAPSLSRQLARQFTRSPLPDLLIPMPLHRTRLKTRGFNQAQLLAASLGRQLQIPVDSRLCHRVRQTRSQMSLSWAERQRNMRHAFACPADLTGKQVAVVDDIMTTGATLNALATVLKKQGAQWISCWILARTLPPAASAFKFSVL